MVESYQQVAIDGVDEDQFSPDGYAIVDLIGFASLMEDLTFRLWPAEPDRRQVLRVVERAGAAGGRPGHRPLLEPRNQPARLTGVRLVATRRRREPDLAPAASGQSAATCRTMKHAARRPLARAVPFPVPSRPLPGHALAAVVVALTLPLPDGAPGVCAAQPATPELRARADSRHARQGVPAQDQAAGAEDSRPAERPAEPASAAPSPDDATATDDPLTFLDSVTVTATLRPAPVRETPRVWSPSSTRRRSRSG